MENLALLLGICLVVTLVVFAAVVDVLKSRLRDLRLEVVRREFATLHEDDDGRLYLRWKL